MSLARLPVEIIIEVVEKFDVIKRSDVKGLLNLRRSCTKLDSIVTPFLRGKLDLRIGTSLKKHGDRITSFSSSPDDVKAWFQAVALDVRDCPKDSDATVSSYNRPRPQEFYTSAPTAVVTEYMMRTARLLVSMKDQISRLEVLLPPEGVPDSPVRRSQHVHGSMELLRYAAQGPLMRNLRHVRSIGGDILSSLMIVRALCPYPNPESKDDDDDDALDDDTVLSVPPRFPSLDSDLQDELGRVSLTAMSPLFARVDTVHMNRGPRSDSTQWVVDLCITPFSPSEAEAHAGTQPPKFSAANGFVPNLQLLKLTGWELDHPIINSLSSAHDEGEIALTLRQLVLHRVRIWHRHYHEDINPVPSPMEELMDVFLPALKYLEYLRVEGLEYICEAHNSDETGARLQPPTPASDEIVSIPSARFMRPIISPFSEDYDSLRRLRDGYGRRRTEKGLPIDPWSEFLVNFDSEVFKVNPASVTCGKSVELALYAQLEQSHP